MKKLVGIAVFVLFISACGSTDVNTAQVSTESIPAEYVGMTNPFDASVAEEGAKTFQSVCESCHGEMGHGDGPASTALNPPPKNLFELQKQVGDDFLFWKISEGSLGTAMVGWRGILTEEQIWEIISFIRTLK